MGWFDLFTVWLSLFSVCFTFLPMMCCWYRHGLMTSDPVNIYLNLFNLVAFTIYTLAFAYYQPIRKYLYLQVMCLIFTVYCIIQYVDGHPEPQRPELMAAIGASAQIVGLAGGVYDIKRAISLKTTEYIPATIQWGILALSSQWTFFGIAIGNYYMAGANLAGLIVNLVTLALYVIYPPKTWVVPILGTGGAEKKKQ